MRKIFQIISQNPIIKAAGISVLYFIFGALWIFFSDELLNSLNISSSAVETIQLYKGWIFVLITSFLFFFFLKKFIKGEAELKTTENKSALSSKKLKSKRIDWFDPLLLVTIFVMISGLLLWMFYLNSVKKDNEAAVEDSYSAKESISLRLEGNEHFLTMIAADRASGILTEQKFQEISSQYIIDHKELTNIKWVDSNYLIKTVSPLDSNRQILGLKINLPEPQRASELAYQTKENVYSSPFEAIQGEPSFEIWVPVFNGSKFLGFFAGVYSCQNLIIHALSNRLAMEYYISLHNSNGGLLADIKTMNQIRHEIKAKVFLDQANNSMYLKLEKYTSVFWGWEIISFIVLISGLLFGLVYGVVILKRDILKRALAEQELFASEIKYKAFFDNSMDAILITSPDGGILSANPSACKMFDRSEEELIELGRNAVIDSSDPRLADLISKRKLEGKAKGELKLIRKDGTRFETELTTELFLDSEGQKKSVMIIRDITERKVAEEKLKESESRLRELHDNVQDVFYRTDLEGIIQEISPSIKYFADFSRDEIINTQVADLYANPNDRMNFLNKLLSMNEIRDYEVKLKTKAGEIRYGSVNARLVKDSENKPHHIDGSIRDITKRKVTENLLRENENRMRLIIEGTPYLFFYTQDTNKNITYISPSVEKITGHSIYEWYNQYHWFVTDNKINEEAKNRTLIHLDGKLFEGPVLMEIEHKNKRLIQLEIYEYPIFEDGKVVGLQGVALDITNQKNTENFLRKLSRAVEQNPASIIITDKNGEIEYVNQKFVDVSGYSKEEVIGQNQRFLKSGRHDNDFYKNLWETILSGKDWNGEILNKKKNGAIYWESQLISPLQNEDGEITHFVSIKEDITEKKRMFEDLISAKEKAEESDKLKTEFLAQISHEIRTPLNVIVSYLSLLKDEFASHLVENNKFIFEGVNSASHRIIRTVNLILDMSEIQTNKYELNPKHLDLYEEIVISVFNEMKHLADLKGIDLRIKKLTDDNKIYFDEYSLSQILMNLVDNAIKFTQKGFVEIRILTNENDLKQLEIEDSGIGIKEEFLDSLFKPFMQEESGYTRLYDGTGLGLSLVKKYCELNWAEISVQSKKNIGTTFTITFNR